MAASCSGFVSSGVSGKSISWLEKRTVCSDYIKETPLQNAPLSELAPPRFKSKNSDPASLVERQAANEYAANEYKKTRGFERPGNSWEI